MENIDKFYGQPVMEASDVYRDNNDTDSSANLVFSISKRWRFVVTIFLIIMFLAGPIILLMKPGYQATAAIRVAPVISNILFTDKNSDNVLPMYKNFVNTQIDLISSDKVLQRVADDLMGKNLSIFESVRIKNSKYNFSSNTEPFLILRKSIETGGISIKSQEDSELIKIKMVSQKPQEAAQVVNSFVRAYMATIDSEEIKGDDHKLTILEDERRMLSEKLDRQREMMRQMSQEYGTGYLQGRQTMMIQRLSSLLAEYTKVQTHKIELQSQIELLENSATQAMDPEKLFQMKHQFVNTDMAVQTLTTNVAQLEQGVIIAKQTLAPTNPELARQIELLSKVKSCLQQRREEIGKSFDEMITKQAADSSKDKLSFTKRELVQAESYEKHLKNLLDKEDSQTIELGRKQLALQDMQEQLNSTKDYYQAVQKRIQELDIEKNRSARISVAYEANIAPVRGKRIKFLAVLLFGAVMLSTAAGIVKDKMDRNLYTPEDVTKHINIRVIGTTTSPESIKKSLLSDQVANDYQTICANLGLYNGENIPHKLVVSSPCPREGKTTLSINLSTSIARTNKKVLLIDGDLRKPDIAKDLHLPCRRNGLKEIFLGMKFDDVICAGPAAGLDILTSQPCKPSAIYQLLTQKRMIVLLEMISQRYDHIIIDSPPALAVPDVFLWAKMADAVILTSLAGSTEASDLKETVERFAKINIKVIGTVLNNVPFHKSYNRYGYGYYATIGSEYSQNKRHVKEVPLLVHEQKSCST